MIECEHSIDLDGIEYSLWDAGIDCPYCRIAELEAENQRLRTQELGFVKTLCSQSEEIGRLKADHQRLRELATHYARCNGHARSCDIREPGKHECDCGYTKLWAALLREGE